MVFSSWPEFFHTFPILSAKNSKKYFSEPRGARCTPEAFSVVLFCTLTILAIIAFAIRIVFKKPRIPNLPKVEIKEVVILKEIPVEKIITKEVLLEKIITVESEDAIKRLFQLNSLRTDLFEKEVMIEHLLKEIKQAPASVNLQPIEIAHRELRKQFAEKSDAYHRLRQQMFALETELLALKKEQEQIEEQNLEEHTRLMQTVGQTEELLDQREEHIFDLEQHVSHPLPKRAPVRRKKAPLSSLQTELFEVLPKRTIGRNRKKTVSSPYEPARQQSLSL